MPFNVNTQWRGSLRDSRRSFLRYLALGPALAGPLSLASRWGDAFALDSGDPPDTSGAGLQSIKTAEQVLEVMEFEQLGHKALPPAHFAYLATGADDAATVRLNHEAYQHIEIRSRRRSAP
jgi:4-hydroxymandelate oxidase